MLSERLYNNPGPKRILALDGGGIRGALTLGFLEKMETILRKRYGKADFRLCDYFDLIVGTSTGGIIAASLAIGMSAGEIRDMYLKLGGEIFGKKRSPWLRGEILRLMLAANYDHRPLEEALAETFGDMTMGDQERFKTGVAIMAKRIDTFSTWTINNFKEFKYYKYNKDILVRDWLRATSAAPTFFPAKEIKVKGQTTGIFIDGGVSLANNPALQGLLLATLKGYSLQWPLSSDQLMLISVGTGGSRKFMTHDKLAKFRSISWAPEIPDIFMEDANYFNQTILQLLSDTPGMNRIDGALGNLEDDHTLGKRLTYRRYNVDMTPEALQTIVGRPFSEDEAADLRKMDQAKNRFTLAEIGKQAAEQQIHPDHLPQNFDV
jgi:hypothetical protein